MVSGGKLVCTAVRVCARECQLISFALTDNTFRDSFANKANESTPKERNLREGLLFAETKEAGSRQTLRRNTAS